MSAENLTHRLPPPPPDPDVLPHHHQWLAAGIVRENESTYRPGARDAIVILYCTGCTEIIEKKVSP